MAHEHHAGCSHDMPKQRHKILNKDNLDVPAEADIDLDAEHPEIQIPQQQYPLTEDELRNDFIMLTEDGGIKKKIITESKQKELGSPPNGSKVICHYTGTLPNNNDEKFDSSRDRNDPFSFKIGEGQVIKGWDIGIASMKKGERCILRCASPYAYGENGSPPKIPGGATLDFDVELIDWDDWQDCSGAEGQISKKVLVTPDDDSYDGEVGEDNKCILSYRIYYVENDIDHIMAERKKIEVICKDDDRFTEAFHTCLSSMKAGEKSLFKVKDKTLMNVDDVYVDEKELKEKEFNNNKITAPDGQLTFYEIFVHEQVKAKEKWNSKNEERIEMGGKFKEDGNVLFKQGRLNGAVNKYKKALDWIDVDFTEEDLGKKKIELVISANNNLSLIYVKKKDWSLATEHATKVLDEDPNNVKALMRRGQARLQDGFLDLSKKDLKKAQKLDKDNTYIKKLLKIVTIKHKEYVEKQQKLYAGMFGKPKKKKKGKKKKDNENNNNKKEETAKNESNKAKDDKMAVEENNNDKSDNKENNAQQQDNDTANNGDKMEVDADKAVSV